MVMIIDRPEPFWLKILLTRIPPTAPSTAKRSGDLRSILACLRIACMVCVDLHVDTDTLDSFFAQSLLDCKFHRWLTRIFMHAHSSCSTLCVSWPKRNFLTVVKSAPHNFFRASRMQGKNKTKERLFGDQSVESFGSHAVMTQTIPKTTDRRVNDRTDVQPLAFFLKSD